MKKEYLFLLSGILLAAIAFSVIQVINANPAIPNPGHGTSDLEGDADLNMASNKITNLAAPVDSGDAATKGYVDTQTGGGVPSGMIAMFDAACPSGWTRFSALDSKFPRGASTYGGTGGSDTHTHTYCRGYMSHSTYPIDPFTDNIGGTECGYITPSCSSQSQVQGGCTNWGIAGIQNTTGSGSNLPSYLNVVWCKKD
jgi:hypothetical protein